MFCLTDAMWMVGAKAATNAMETHCPICGEEINYYPPDSIGYCSCGYCTES